MWSGGAAKKSGNLPHKPKVRNYPLRRGAVRALGLQKKNSGGPRLGEKGKVHEVAKQNMDRECVGGAPGCAQGKKKWGEGIGPNRRKQL